MDLVFIRVIRLSLLIIAISGCTTLPELPDIADIEQIDQLTAHQHQLAKIANWQLTGRVAINFNDESWNASIHWQKFADRYAIQLYLPLGQGSMQLTGGTNGAILKTDDGEHFEAESSEALFLQQFGLILPLSSLQDWVMGRPAKEAEDPGDWLQQVDQYGRMLSLQQAQWDLRLLGYRPVHYQNLSGGTDLIALPRKLFMYQNGNSVRLVVDRWQFDD